MNATKRILAVVDPTVVASSERQHAVARGLALASAFDAQLHLFVCHYDEYLAGERFGDSAGLQRARESFVAEWRKWLERFAATLPRSDVDLSVDAVWDHPLHEGILRKLDRYRPDLVIKDTHHHNRLQRALFTPTDWQLMRKSTVPLLLSQNAAWPEPPKVLAAVDPLSEHDKPASLDLRILDTSRRFADALGGDVHVFHNCPAVVTNAPFAAGVAPPLPPPVDHPDETVFVQHARAVEELLAGRDVPAEHVHIRGGVTSMSLAEVARELEPAIVVMGAVKRSLLQRLFIGSTAERVIDRLPCDVLVVPTLPGEVAGDR